MLTCRHFVLTLVISALLPIAVCDELLANDPAAEMSSGSSGIIERAGQQGRIHMNVDENGKKTPGGFVALTATVDPKATIGPKAMVLDKAQVGPNALVDEYAIVAGEASITDFAKIKKHGRVEGQAVVGDRARVSGYAIVTGTAFFGGQAHAAGDAFFDRGRRMGGNANWGYNQEARAAYIKEHGLEKYYAHMKIKKKQ